MTDKPRRPTRSPKNPPPPKPVPEPVVAPVAAPKPFAFSPRPSRAPKREVPAPVVYGWRCKPCGTGFNVPTDLAEDESVRCPACNARLGLLKDFQGDEPNLAKVRARKI